MTADHPFFALHRDLPREGPGSDATARLLLSLAAPLPEEPRVLDLGCGPGPAALLLAAEIGARVAAVDTHQPFLDRLAGVAASRGLDRRIETANLSIAELPYPDRSVDLIWSEGAAYTIGYETALRSWRRLLAPGGVLVVSECEWTTDTPSEEARAFWDEAYPLRTREQNLAIARSAGYVVVASHLLPDADWAEYYGPLAERVSQLDPAGPGMAAVLAEASREIEIRQKHGAEYGYTAYVLRPA